MTDPEMTDRLKARLSAWKGYLEQAQDRAAQTQTPEAPAVDLELAVTVSRDAAPAEPMPPEAVPVVVPDSLIERYEQQIADLRAALDHERNHCRFLSETLAREQALRACDPRSGRNGAAPAGSLSAGGDRRPDRYEHAENELRANILWLFILLAGIVCGVVLYLH